MTLKRAFRLIKLVQEDASYEKIVEFLFGEIPPKDSNFLQKENLECITEDIQSAAYQSTNQHFRRDIDSHLHPQYINEHTEKLFKVASQYINLNQLEKEPNPSDVFEFSVIIPVYNGKDRIRETIKSLLSQSVIRDSYEIIVVEDGSIQRSDEILKDFINKNPDYRIRYVYYSKNRGPAFARNIGILLSRGAYLCFTDDDCTLPTDWLSEFRKDFQDHPEIAGTGGWYRPVVNQGKRKLSIFNKSIFWDSIPETLQTIKSPGFLGNMTGNTANVCYKKSVVEDVGGFNHYFIFASYEDLELKARIQKSKYPLLYRPRFIEHRKRDLNFFDFILFYLIRGWACYFLYLLHPDYKFYNRNFSRVVSTYFLVYNNLKANQNYALPQELMFSYKLFFTFLFSCVSLWLGKYGTVLWNRKY